MAGFPGLFFIHFKETSIMRLIRPSVLLACTLLCSLTWSQTPATPTAPASAASAPTGPSIRAEVRTPLLDAQNLINAKNYAEAKQKVQVAMAVPNQTAFETYLIHRIALSIAVNEDDAPNASKYLDKVLELNASGNWIKHDETLQLMRAVSVTHYRIKAWGNAIGWMERYLQAGGTEQSVKDVRMQAYLLDGKFERGSELLTEEINAAEKANKTPAKPHLDLLFQARNNLKDTVGSTRVLEKLVLHYPNKDYWRSLLNRLWSRADLAPRLQLDVFRLANYVGTLEETADFTEYVDFAQKAGLSAEALQVFDKGVSAGQVGSGANADAHKKLRAKLAQEVEQDRKTMPVDTTAALKKPDGLALYNIGQNMVGMQQYDKGIELMEKGLAKGLAKRPEDARLRLAVAYVQAGQLEKAQAAFGAVSGGEGLDDLVRYWKWAIRKP